MSEADPIDAPWEKNFRRHMAAEREHQGLSQTAFAKLLSARGLPFHQQTVQRVEAGERPVRLDEAFIIADELGLRAEDMVKPFNVKLAAAFYASKELERAGVELAAKFYDDELSNFVAAIARVQSTFDLLMGADSEGAKRQLAVLSAWINRGWHAARRGAETYGEFVLGFSGKDPGPQMSMVLDEMPSSSEISLSLDSQFWEALPERERPRYLISLPWRDLSTYTDNIMNPLHNG